MATFAEQLAALEGERKRIRDLFEKRVYEAIKSYEVEVGEKVEELVYNPNRTPVMGATYSKSAVDEWADS